MGVGNSFQNNKYLLHPEDFFFFFLLNLISETSRTTRLPPAAPAARLILVRNIPPDSKKSVQFHPFEPSFPRLKIAFLFIILCFFDKHYEKTKGLSKTRQPLFLFIKISFKYSFRSTHGQNPKIKFFILNGHMVLKYYIILKFG